MSDFSEMLRNKLKDVPTSELEKVLSDAIMQVSNDKVEVLITDIKFGNQMESTKISMNIDHLFD